METEDLMQQLALKFIDTHYPKTDTRRGFVMLYTIQLLDYLKENKIDIKIKE